MKAVCGTIDSSVGIPLGIAGCYAAGLVYGAVCRIDRKVTGVAFAVAIATKLLFDEISERYLIGTVSKKTFHATRLIGDALFYAATIIAFRHFNIIGQLGTACLAFGALISVLQNVSHLIKA